MSSADDDDDHEDDDNDTVPEQHHGEACHTHESGVRMEGQFGENKKKTEPSPTALNVMLRHCVISLLLHSTG